MFEEGIATPESREGWYGIFYECSPSMDFVIDDEGRVLLVNRFGAEQLGYEPEELIGKPVLDVYREEDREGIRRHLRACLESPGRLFRGEYRKVRKDGGTVWIQDSSRAIEMDGGRKVVLVSCDDVTELKRTQQELARLGERHRRILESVGEGVCSLDLGGRVVFSNLPGAEMLGYEVEELVGRPFHEVVHHTKADGTPYPGEECVIQAMLGDGEARHVADEVFWCKDGAALPVEYTSTPTLEDGEVTGAVVTFRDATERKRTEETLTEIREAERRRIARDLHDVALQDLVGVLQSIRASGLELEEAGTGLNLEPETRALQTAIKGLRDAIHDLRSERRQDFVESVEALVELNRQLVPEQRIELSIAANDPCLKEMPEAARTELVRVIREALANARRHARARKVRVAVGAGDGQVWAEVSDDGRGFDPDTVRRGVGLSGTRDRVLALGGEVEVDSEVGTGTRITARLPAAGRNQRAPTGS